jgi:acetyl-CoA carboxylase alpha subunit
MMRLKLINWLEEEHKKDNSMKIITTELFELNVAHGIIPEPASDVHCSHPVSNERIYIVSILELISLLRDWPAAMLVAQHHSH